MENSVPDQDLYIFRNNGFFVIYSKKEIEKFRDNLLKYHPEAPSIQLYTDVVSYAKRNITLNLTISFNY